MVELLVEGALGILLLVISLQDVRTKKVSLCMILLGAVLVCIGIPFIHSLSLIDRVFGIMVGVSVIITSKATGGKIGLGDGYLLCVTGAALGFWGNMELFAMALFAAAIVSIFLLAFRLANRKMSIPFIPFLFLAYLIDFIGSRTWIFG